MAEWQMSSWQPVRPAEPEEDESQVHDAAEPQTRDGGNRASDRSTPGTGDRSPAIGGEDSSPWQRRAAAGGTSSGNKAGPVESTSVPEKPAVVENAPVTAVHDRAVPGTAIAGRDENSESTPAVEVETTGRRRAAEGTPAPAPVSAVGFRSTPVPMPPDSSSEHPLESNGQRPRDLHAGDLQAGDLRAGDLQAGNLQDLGLQGQLPPVAAASALDLTNALLVRQVSPPPTSGWRRWLHTVTGRRVNLGNSARDERLVRLTRQVDRHLVGCYRVSVLSLKGGVGKTTTTATLGSTFASIRGDRVIAVDANPDRGTLSQKVPVETPATVRNLLRDIDELDRYSDIRGYTSQNSFRLEVLASDSDPAVSEAFSGQDYDNTVTLLEKFYSIVLTDCGTGLMHSAMSRILAGSDALVVVSSSSVDGARSASATLDWLDAHGHRDLVRSSVAVVNAVRPRAGKVDLAKVVEHFEQRCRQVVLIPFDPHLEEGAEIDLNRLKRRTRAALLELAAAVASGFPSNRPEDIARVREQRQSSSRDSSSQP